MIITNYQVQHILKAYSQQLSDGSRVSKDRGSRKIVQKDEVTLSQESRKRLTADRIANEIITQLANSSERNETGQEILDRLSQEYGQPLEIASDNGNGGNGLAFKVLDGEKGKTIGSLSPTEAEALKKRLIDIARSVVYHHLA